MHHTAEKHLLGRRMENSYCIFWSENCIVKCNKICEDWSQILWHTGAIGRDRLSWAISSVANVAAEKVLAWKLLSPLALWSEHPAPAPSSYRKLNWGCLYFKRHTGTGQKNSQYISKGPYKSFKHRRPGNNANKDEWICVTSWEGPLPFDNGYV